MKPGAKFEVINPPNSLAAKVSPHGGPSLESIVREAEQALEDLQESYQLWVRQDLDNIVRLAEEAETDPAVAKGRLQEIAQITHDIKGQGATFEYPLLTHVARSLYKLLVESEGSNEQMLKLVRVHADAMNVIVKEDLRGASDELGKQLVEMLNKAVDKVIGA